MIIVESLINNVSYVVEFKDLTSLSISQAIAAKNTSEQVLQQVNNQRYAIETIQALVQDLRDQSEAFWASSGQSASSALANKNATDVNLAQTLSALNSAVQIAMGQATGIAGVIPRARIRAGMTSLPPEFSFTRSSNNATAFDRNFNLTQFSANQPRFEFDRSGQARGLLVESSSINHIHNPTFNNFQTGVNIAQQQWARDQAYGSNIEAIVNEISTIEGIRTITISVNGTPTGTNDLLIRATPASRQSILPGQVVFVHGYIQAISSLRNFNFDIRVGWFNSSGTNISNSVSGPLGNQSTNQLSYVTYQSSPAPVDAVSYRLWLTVTNGSLSPQNLLFRFGGFQSEVGFRSSFIPEHNVLRAADNCRLITSFLNQQEGTFLMRVCKNTPLLQSLFLVNDGTSNNQIGLNSDGVLYVTLNGVTQTVSSGSSAVGQYDIYSFSYTRTRLSISRNGAVCQVINISNLFNFVLCSFETFAENSSKHFHTLKYLRKALTDAQLQVRSNPLTFYGFENGDVALNADLSDAAFTNINAIQRLPSRSDIPFPGTGAAAQRIFSLDFASTLQLVHLPAGGTYSVSAGTTVVPGTTVIPAGTNITVDFNVANNNVLILAFLPAIQ